MTQSFFKVVVEASLFMDGAIEHFSGSLPPLIRTGRLTWRIYLTDFTISLSYKTYFPQGLKRLFPWLIQTWERPSHTFLKYFFIYNIIADRDLSSSCRCFFFVAERFLLDFFLHLQLHHEAFIFRSRRYEVSSKTNATPPISQSRDVWRINLINITQR